MSQPVKNRIAGAEQDAEGLRGTNVRFVESGAVHAVGLVATCPESELSVVVPKLWDMLGSRLADVSQRLERDRQVSIFLGRRGDIFTEFVGVVVPEDAPTPDGMVRIDVPAGTYAATDHLGPDVQGSYRRVFDWVGQQGLVVAPYERRYHHLEWYREPVLRGELEFEIWVRVQPTA